MADTILKRLHDTLPGVTPLTDPGDAKGRVALLFQERAEWLYLTGHRQGDLRRLLRQYPQYWPEQELVYPSGQLPRVRCRAIWQRCDCPDSGE